MITMNAPKLRRTTFQWMLLIAVIGLFMGQFVCTSSSKRILNAWQSSSQHQQHVLEEKQKQKDGWHTIQVFYGDSDLYIPPNITEEDQWFSQAKQDKIVASLLRNQRDGYFVDLAANDAVHISNTLALERKFGWKGLCIEANPEYWRGLSFRDCQVVAAAVGGAHRLEKVQFNLRKVMGGIVADNFDNTIRKGKQVAYYTVPLEEILEQNDAPTVIDYMSLDVEGAETYVMDNFPFDKYMFKILTVERPKPDLRNNFESNGYQFVRNISYFGETLWVHESVADSLDLASQKKFRQFG